MKAAIFLGPGRGYSEGQRAIAGAICPTFTSYVSQDGSPVDSRVLARAAHLDSLQQFQGQPARHPRVGRGGGCRLAEVGASPLPSGYIRVQASRAVAG
jgi:hypothetical protein